VREGKVKYKTLDDLIH